MCKFCEAMQRHRRCETILKKTDPDMEYRYSVAIVSRMFFKGRPGPRGTRTDYRFRGCGYQLNYCPECGAKIGRELHGLHGT